MADARIATYIDFLLTGGQFENLPKPITLTEQSMYAYCRKQKAGGFTTSFRKQNGDCELPQGARLKYMANWKFK